MTKFHVPSLSVLVLITSLDIIYHFPKSTSEVTSFRAYPSNPCKDDISCILGLLFILRGGLNHLPPTEMFKDFVKLNHV